MTDNCSTINPVHPLHSQHDTSAAKDSDSEAKGRKPRQRPLCNTLREFFTDTTLHGFRYILDDRLNWFERLWWVSMVIASVMVCAFYIWKVWDKWDKTPVIVSFAETSNSIPFPAVTICSETKSRQRIFNFSKAYIERWGSASTINPEDLQTYDDLLMVCNNPHNDGPDYADANSINVTLKRLAPTREDMFLDCIWEGLKCSDMFYHTLTKDGYCFTFNMLPADEMFRTENLHHEYHHVAIQNKSKWTLQKGYSEKNTVNTYPLRGPSYGGVEFEVILSTDTRDIDLVCRGPVQGFKIWLHSPAELPNMGQNFFRLPIQYQSAASITPKVMVTSEGLKNYPPYKRQCYFPEERYLKFFRTYTHRNCELECKSNFTAKVCGCVTLYMPHDRHTKVCGGGKHNCIIKALEMYSLGKSLLSVNSETERAGSHVIPDVKSCDCLQACTELSYDAEVSQAVYNLTNFRNNSDPDIVNGWRIPSGLVLYFAEEVFTSLRRSELYGGVDFLANCGGIMGLFMGFSFLSLVEIVYYFTIRLWRRMRDSSRVAEKHIQLTT